jgi:hypothetical protein
MSWEMGIDKTVGLRAVSPLHSWHQDEHAFEHEYAEVTVSGYCPLSGQGAGSKSQPPALCSSDISKTKSGVRLVELHFRRLRGTWWHDWHMSRRVIGFWVSSPGHGSNDMVLVFSFFLPGVRIDSMRSYIFLQERYWFSGK